MRFVDCLQRETVVRQSCHGNIISGTQQTVDGPANMAEKRKKMTCMTFLYIIALRNITLAPLSVVEIHKFCYHGNVTSHFLLLSDLLFIIIILYSINKTCKQTGKRITEEK